TEKEQPLEYYGQSGALNESISDVFGECVRQKVEGTSADQADWVLAKGCWKNGFKGNGLRNMLHPGTAFDDPRLGKDRQPDSMANYVKTTDDRG
ncbi:M4 family metallopeptidase, partial [Acinetobacter baumannii]